MVKRVGGGILPTAVSLAVTGRRGEITGIFSTGRRHTKYVKNLFTLSVSHSRKQGYDNVSLNISYARYFCTPDDASLSWGADFELGVRFVVT
jgi:hypothetical protein